jgi:DNA transformation protein
MFALIADDTLYLKADGTTMPAFEAEGMKAFTYTSKGRKPITMSYWELPPRLLEEPDELAEWARAAHRIACATKKPARKKTSRKRKP